MYFTIRGELKCVGCPGGSGPVACCWIIFSGTANKCVMINFKIFSFPFPFPLPLLFVYFLLNKKKQAEKLKSREMKEG